MVRQIQQATPPTYCFKHSPSTELYFPIQVHKKPASFSNPSSHQSFLLPSGSHCVSDCILHLVPCMWSERQILPNQAFSPFSTHEHGKPSCNAIKKDHNVLLQKRVMHFAIILTHPSHGYTENRFLRSDLQKADKTVHLDPAVCCLIHCSQTKTSIKGLHHKTSKDIPSSDNLQLLLFAPLVLDPLLPIFLHLQVHPASPVPVLKCTRLLVQARNTRHCSEQKPCETKRRSPVTLLERFIQLVLDVSAIQ